MLTYAMTYTGDNDNVIGVSATESSLADALRKLAAVMDEHPELEPTAASPYSRPRVEINVYQP